MSATGAQNGADSETETEAERQRDVLRRILAQRVSRFGEGGPDLAPLGAARFRQDGRKLLVAYAVAQPGMAPQLVERVLAYARRQALFLHWFVVPQAPGEERLPAALLAAGMRLDERLFLMARHGAIAAPVNTPENAQAHIELVASFDAMRAYEHGSRRSFNHDDYPDDRMVASRAADRWRQQSQGWYRYYIALMGERIVGGCYVTLWEDVPTIMGVYTLPEARGQGVATTVLSHVTEEIVRSGRDPYCLYVKDDNPAQRLYLRLGFTPLATEETYLASVEPRL